MTEFVRGRSSVFRFEAHVSFKTKHSHKVFDIVEFKERCREMLLEAAADIGIRIIEIGFDLDHVHLILAWLRITLSLDRIAKALKNSRNPLKSQIFYTSNLTIKPQRIENPPILMFPCNPLIVAEEYRNSDFIPMNFHILCTPPRRWKPVVDSEAVSEIPKTVKVSSKL